ncbi:MAG: lipase maturation factor family protein [Methylomonas sp.]|jgi:hypothetical protein
MKILSRLLDNSKHILISWLFLRGLALIYFAAFASMAVQIDGLIGENGILPVQSVLAIIARYFPDDKYIAFPTLFWLDASDRTLLLVCYAGMLGAALLLSNLADRPALILCYGLYLSISVAGQDFTSFQWDALLLEAGFLGLFLTWGSAIAVYCYRWLIARFMFMAGVVKLASGDPAWLNLTALNYHYLTQPLPTPLAYYAHYLPQWFGEACVAGVFIVEIIVPFFVFLPRRFRLIAAWSFILLQFSIILTGNYNFFNLLTILICLFLFDDRDIGKILPARLINALKRKQPSPGPTAHAIAALWLCAAFLVNAAYIWIYQVRQPIVSPLKNLAQLASEFSLINNYGPFAVMTKERHEIIVQGSNDGENWLTYQFKYKPGRLEQKLGWIIPHQPRLDWQMWFAALDKPTMDAWFVRFILKLREGSPRVLALLAENPFPEKPPVYVRALLYRYFYTTPEQRAASGEIWRREYLGVYWPANNGY